MERTKTYEGWIKELAYLEVLRPIIGDPEWPAEVSFTCEASGRNLDPLVALGVWPRDLSIKDLKLCQHLCVKWVGRMVREFSPHDGSISWVTDCGSGRHIHQLEDGTKVVVFIRLHGAEALSPKCEVKETTKSVKVWEIVCPESEPKEVDNGDG